LKSFSKFPSYLILSQGEEVGKSNPEKWQAAINKLAQENNSKDIVPNIHVEVVRGDVSFPEFLKTLEKVNDENTQVAVNYLQPALFIWLHAPQMVSWAFHFGTHGWALFDHCWHVEEE
jgi:hypothetical protein